MIKYLVVETKFSNFFVVQVEVTSDEVNQELLGYRIKSSIRQLPMNSIKYIPNYIAKYSDIFAKIFDSRSDAETYAQSKKNELKEKKLKDCDRLINYYQKRKDYYANRDPKIGFINTVK